MEGNRNQSQDYASSTSSAGPARGTSTASGGDIDTDTDPGGAEQDAEESSSSSEESTSTALQNFRKEWEVELKHITASTSTGKSIKNNTPSNPAPMSNSQGKLLAGLSPAAQGSSFAPTPTSRSRKESNSQSPLPIKGSKPNANSSDSTGEEEAKRLFLMGVSFERRGDLYDAVRYYRRAMQLVPDIEKRVMIEGPGEIDTPSSGGSNLQTPRGENSDESDEEDNDESTLVVKFLQSIREDNAGDLFQKANTVPDGHTNVHLNDFPVELLFYILRWVISDELDLRTLDVLSSVSKGFYCLCRDDQLWKLACDRVWSASSSLIDSRFLTYRDMFLNRPRVRYDGCYMSRVTYVRPGEHSFQDQSYRPWHMVEYFRYIRFFPDGKIHFLTTAERPASTVGSLRDRETRNPGILKGSYRLYGNNLISAAVTKSNQSFSNSQFRKSRSEDKSGTTTFHMDFEIEEPINDRNRARKYNWVLRWTYYAVYINKTGATGSNRNNNNPGTGVTSTFELTPSKYPPLHFSRVKSYTSKSENILE